METSFIETGFKVHSVLNHTLIEQLVLNPLINHALIIAMAEQSVQDLYQTRFPVLDDPRPDDVSLQAFLVSTTRGFLPRMDPVVTLPAEFEVLESILQRMPVKMLSGEPGLLAHGGLGDVVTKELPDLTDFIDKYKDNLPLMNALYRDYSFLASAYLLEPCHQRFLRGESYGLGRQVLPANIARPIARCAELCQFKPFMEYAGSYALYNYKLDDPSKGLEYSNLRLIRAFEHGLDPTSSEAGFVLVHIDMVKNSGPLVAGVMECLDVCRAAMSTASSTHDQDTLLSSRRTLNQGLSKILSTLRLINATMETMWQKSKPGSYTSFRTFIFGITAQSMFPNGVIYAGVPNPDSPDPNHPTPLSFRGESGANDSMIPLMDNFLQIPMPDTPLTEILDDFRSYRPSNHRAFLAWVKGNARMLNLRDWITSPKLDVSPDDLDHELWQSRRTYLQILNQVRDFRWRHWCFAKEYILKQTSHPTATGGSPIVTWLPNQLEAVLADMVRVYGTFTEEERQRDGECRDIMEMVERQRVMLQKEVSRFCQERSVPSPSASTGGGVKGMDKGAKAVSVVN